MLQGLSNCYNVIYSLYSGFVGAPHFRVVAKLLGYQGIAVVIEELLKIVKSLVRLGFCSAYLDDCHKLCRNHYCIVVNVSDVRRITFLAGNSLQNVRCACYDLAL